MRILTLLVLAGGIYLNPWISPSHAALMPQRILFAATSADVLPTSLAEAEERLLHIAKEMGSIRFCNRTGGCRYDAIQATVTPVNESGSQGSTPPPLYIGSIDAEIVRPADYPDRAHYTFEFRDDHWILLGGEEVSDVSSFLFNRNYYEVFSSYSGRIRVNKLEDASPNLRIGYRALYYRVMDQGSERR